MSKTLKELSKAYEAAFNRAKEWNIKYNTAKRDYERGLIGELAFLEAKSGFYKASKDFDDVFQSEMRKVS